MPFIYAMSDIHGELDAFIESLSVVDLSKPESKLVLLGDYIDRGSKSCEVLCFVKELSEKYPDQVIPLRGNHEDMFLEQLYGTDTLLTGESYNEMQNYLSDEELEHIASKCSPTLPMQTRIEVIYEEMISQIKVKHKELLGWISDLPHYYETDDQIFVHAGVDEEAGECWKLGTDDHLFLWKYPHTIGRFYKDIIAGHVHTSTIAQDPDYHTVYWDKANHYYIDGHTNESKVIPVLKYDTVSRKYLSFEKHIGWVQITIA